MGRTKSTAVTVVLIVAALAAGAAALARPFRTSRETQLAIAPLPNWNELLATASGLPSHLPTGRSVLIEFGEYDCEQCAPLSRLVDSISGRALKFVAVGYIHVSSDGHRDDAPPAALAAECANEQGRFRAYHSALRRSASLVTENILEGIAGDVGLDLQVFRRCLKNRATKPIVDRHTLAGRELGMRARQTFYLDGVRVHPDSVLAAIDSAVARHMRSSSNER